MPGGTEVLTSAVEHQNRALEGENRTLSEEEEAARQNSVRLAELQRSAAEAERAPKKERESFFGKIFRAVANSVGWLFGKYKGKTGERNDRSGNEFQNMLIAKTQFQQGGFSAFAADTSDSLVMSAREGSENAVADFSMSSIHKSNTDEGEQMAGGTVDITYKNKLKLIAPAADFKHRYLSDTTVDYSSANAQLFFMGAFRDISTKAGKFTIERNMSIDVDKFAEIASLEYDLGTNHIKLPDFVLSDSNAGPKMAFAGGGINISKAGDFSVNAEGLSVGEAGMEPITAGSSGIKFDAGLVGHEEYIPLSGGLTLGEAGLDAGNSSFSLGKIEKYKGIFGATDINGALSNQADGSLGYSLGADKWVVDYKDNLINLIKGGERAELSLDTAKRLHVISDAGAAIDLNLLPLGLQLPTILSGEKTDFAIGDDSFTTTVERGSLGLFGKPATGVKVIIDKNSTGSKLGLEAATLDLGENMKVSNVKGSIGSDGLILTSGTFNMENIETESFEAEGILGTVTNLKLNKSGVTFDDISATVSSISIGDTFEADSVAAHLSRTKELGFGIKGEFTKLSAELESESKDLSVDVKDLSGSLELSKIKKSLVLDDKGHIDLTYGECIFVSLKGLSLSYDEAGFGMTVGQGYGTFQKDSKDSPFGGVVDFDTFTTHIQNLSIANKTMTVGEGGIFKLDFEGLKLFDKEIGDVSLAKTDTGFEGSIANDDGVSKKFGDTELKLSGEIGFVYTAATKKFAPNLEKTKVELGTDKIEFSVEGLKMENQDTLVIDSVTLGFKSKNIFGGDGETPGAEISASELKIGKAGVSFKEIAAKLNKEFTFWNDGLTIGNPKIGVVNNFSGFSLGGTVKVNSPYFATGGDGTVFFEKANGFKPKVSSIEGFSVSIPNLAQLKIEKTSFNEENVIEFENLQYESGFNEDSFKDKSGFFYKLCSLGKDIKVNLEKAKYQDKKFQYEFADINYFGSKFSQKFGPVEVSIEFEKDSATVSAAFELIMPKQPEDAKKTSKESFTHLLNLSFEGPVCPFVNVGASLFAGADLDLEAKAQATFNYGEEKGFLGELSATVKKAVAGLGVEGFVSFGVPMVSEIQLGLRGVLAGDLNGTKLEGKLGLNKTEKGIEINKDPEATSIEAALKGKLTAKLQAFVRPMIVFLNNKDLFTYDIANVNLFSCSVGGKGAYEGDVWRFKSDGFEWSSDFNRDSFDPNDPKSLLSRSQVTIADFKALEGELAGVENAIGVQDWASEGALEKSIELQKQIIPKFETIRKKAADAFSELKENDAAYSGNMIEADEHILKHKERLQNMELAKQGMAMATAPAPETTEAAAPAKPQTADEIKATNKSDAEKFVETAGGLAPALVWAYLSKKLDLTGKVDNATFASIAIRSFANKVSEMQQQYVELRRTIKEIGNDGVAGAVRAKTALAGASPTATAAEKAKIAAAAAKPIDKSVLKQQYDQSQTDLTNFVKSTNKEFESRAKVNVKPISDLQSVNVAIAKQNAKIEAHNHQYEVLSNELVSMMNMSEGYKRMKTAEGDKMVQTLKDKIQDKMKEVKKSKDESEELAKEKLKLIEQLEKARGAVDVQALESEKNALSAQNEGFTSQRETVATTRKAFMGPERINTLDMSVKSFIPDEAAIAESGVSKDDLKYDATRLAKFYDTKNIVGLGRGVTFASLTHEQFSAYADLLITAKGKEQIGKYKEYLGKFTVNDYIGTPTSGDSKAILAGLFSIHGVNTSEDKVTEPLTMGDLETYTQGRINAYESRKATIAENEKSLEETVLGSNTLYNRAVDAFSKMNSIHRDDFLAKPTFSDSYHKQLNKLVVAEEQLKSGEFSEARINAFDAEADNAIKKAGTNKGVFEQIKQLNAG